MKRAALYIRVSTDEQARHGLSLGEQRADLERYANAHHYAIVGIYADEGSTARKALSRRKELQRLLDDVRAGKIDIIVFKCLDRWFRNIRDYYKVQDILDAHHVDWECTQEKYNTTTTNGRLMLNIKLSVAQNESDMTSDRIRYINEGKLRRGEVLNGRVPYGYVVKNRKYVIDEDAAKVVRMIFERFSVGDSSRRIAQDIYAAFGVSLSMRRVRTISQNPAYIGTYRGVEDYHPAIVPRDIFARAQEVIKAHPRPIRKGRTYLFSGKLLCPSCGCRLVGRYRPAMQGAREKIVYLCGKRIGTGKVTGEDVCKFKGTVSESLIERWLVEHMAELVEEYIANAAKGSKKNLKTAERKKKAAEAKLSRTKELYIDGLIEKDELKRRAAEFQHDIDEAALEIERSRTRIPDNIVLLRSQLDEFPTMYENLDRLHRREFWQSIIKCIRFPMHPRRPGMKRDMFFVELY